MSIVNTQALIPNGCASSVGGYVYLPSMTGGPLIVDVGRWVLHEVFEEAPLSCAGNMGATESLLVGYNYPFEMDLIFDVRNPVDVKLRGTDPFAVQFFFGDLIGFPALGSSPVVDNKSYWTPGAKMDTFVPTLDAATHRVVRAHVTGHAVAHVMLLPDMGDINDNNTVAGAYNTWWGSN